MWALQFVSQKDKRRRVVPTEPKLDPANMTWSGNFTLKLFITRAVLKVSQGWLLIALGITDPRVLFCLRTGQCFVSQASAGNAKP